MRAFDRSRDKNRRMPIGDDNPPTGTPGIAVALNICCAVVFQWQRLHSDDDQQIIVYALAAKPAALFAGAIIPEDIAVRILIADIASCDDTSISGYRFPAHLPRLLLTYGFGAEFRTD